jgi:hypothetical protein
LTDRQVAKRVDFWRKELELLGLSHWQLQLDIEDDLRTHHGDERANASVHTEDFYDAALIKIDSDVIPEDTPPAPHLLEHLDYCIVHELLHVAMRDFDAAIESIKDHLAPAAASQWEDRLEHEEEGFVDRTARAIVRMYHRHQG